MKLILTLTVCLKVGKVIKLKITMFVVNLKCVFKNYNVVSIRIQEQQKHTTVLRQHCMELPCSSTNPFYFCPGIYQTHVLRVIPGK